MVPHLRESFNRNFKEDKHQLLMKRLDALCGTHVEFPVCETPLFVPRPLMQVMETSGKEIIMQLVTNPEYLAASERAIPDDFRVPNDSPHPLFVSLDFGITRDQNRQYVPRLIEMQGFATLYAYQVVLHQLYREVYGLSQELRALLGGLDLERYNALLRRAILGDHDPENVILMEIDPLRQKTLPDFILTERLCGIATVNIRDIMKQGTRLSYTYKGKDTPIHRIYNRTIIEDLVKSSAKTSFSFRDELDVEWAGHPNWFFRLSKFSLPFLSHPAVPKTRFLSDCKTIPDDLEHWVLKPLFSFAGGGVRVAPTRADIDAVPERQRMNYVLQEKVDYGEFVETPYGGTKAEVRIMYIWLDQPVAVNNLVRMGRGKMMGVDHNKNMRWVGSSAGYYP